MIRPYYLIFVYSNDVLFICVVMGSNGRRCAIANRPKLTETSSFMRKELPSPLACPACGSDLFLSTTREEGEEVLSGSLGCPDCDVGYPILAGVAVLVEDVGGYLAQHVKGISPHVGEEEIPTEFRDAYLEAKEEIESEHIEEDLEIKRVVSLYLMNHYRAPSKRARTGNGGKRRRAPPAPSSKRLCARTGMPGHSLKSGRGLKSFRRSPRFFALWKSDAA